MKPADIQLMHKAGLSLEEIDITVLMHRDKIPWRWGNKPVILKPEQKLSVEVADMMRAHIREKRYRGVWFSVPNEGVRTPLTAIILRAMGMIPGATDHVFMGMWGHGGIELKPEGKTLEEDQRRFKRWCEREGIPHALCRSKASVEEKLKEWGALCS